MQCNLNAMYELEEISIYKVCRYNLKSYLFALPPKVEQPSAKESEEQENYNRMSKALLKRGAYNLKGRGFFNP